MYAEKVPFSQKLTLRPKAVIRAILDRWHSEMAAEPSSHTRGPLHMLSLLQIPLRMSSCFQQGGGGGSEKVPFQPLFTNIGEKPAFQNLPSLSQEKLRNLNHVEKFLIIEQNYPGVYTDI